MKSYTAGGYDFDMKKVEADIIQSGWQLSFKDLIY